MTKYEVKALAREIDRMALEICDNYETCETCPFNTKWSIITQRNGNKFGANCMPIAMQRVFADNLSQED